MPESFEIAVLIPHFNNRAGLQASIASIRYSGKLVLVLVDDGSDVENLPDDVWIQGREDEWGYPIRLVALDENRGIEEALNAGLRYIQSHLSATYVARLDCGDCNDPDRLDQQVSYLQSHPNVSLVGTWAKMVSQGSVKYILRMPLDHQQIVRRMYYNNSFIHPTVLFRTDCLASTGHYPLRYPAAEDYAFFLEFTRRYLTANLGKVLVSVSMEEHNISRRQRRRQLQSRLRIILDNFHFHPLWFWGVLRTLMLMLIPLRIVENFKQIAFHEDSSRH